MLEIKIDLIEHGIESKRETLETIKIINTGLHKKRPEYGQYIIHHKNGSFLINNHKRDNGYLPLVQKAICGYINCILTAYTSIHQSESEI